MGSSPMNYSAVQQQYCTGLQTPDLSLINSVDRSTQSIEARTSIILVTENKNVMYDSVVKH